MKKIFTAGIIISLFALNLQARVITVSNVPGSVAMFSSVQVAIDSAKVADTVFIHASSTAYGNAVIKRRIVLLGEGGKPTYNGVSSQVSGISIDSLGGVPVSGTYILGLEAGSLTIAAGIKGVIVKNCYVKSTTNLYGSGHLIVNNVFSYIVNLGSNITFSNNIHTTYNIGSGSNCVISNNIFIFSSASYIPFSNLTNCTVVNNIILSALSAVSGGIGNSYSKNIQAGTDLPAGNFSNVQPVNIFSESTISTGMSIAQVLGASWKQLPASVGKNAGTDGKDIGVYGGPFPWPSDKIFNGDPGLPKVEIVILQNAVIAPNGTLIIDFKAKSASKK